MERDPQWIGKACAAPPLRASHCRRLPPYACPSPAAVSVCAPSSAARTGAASEGLYPPVTDAVVARLPALYQAALVPADARCEVA